MVAAMSHGGGDAAKVIRAALFANLGIATCKFIAAYLSGSTATLAEAVHSVADTGNQILLFVGLRLATTRKDDLFAFGRAMERYFWPFLVAILLFSVGGAFALYEGIHKLVHPEPVLDVPFFSLRGPGSSVLVLGVSVVLEGYSCSVALAEFRASAKGKRVDEALFGGKDPTIPLVLMEDVSALIGLALALGAVLLTTWTRDARWDAAGSVVIGLLLMVVSVLIARDTHGLLVGERATPEMEERTQRLIEGTPGVRRLTQLLTMHLGPDFVLLAVKVAFAEGMKVEECEQVIDELERRVRAEVPEMKKIFVEPDARGDMRGVRAASRG
jgi:cation diffusion facilitator family transporter